MRRVASKDDARVVLMSLTDTTHKKIANLFSRQAVADNLVLRSDTPGAHRQALDAQRAPRKDHAGDRRRYLTVTNSPPHGLCQGFHLRLRIAAPHLQPMTQFYPLLMTQPLKRLSRSHRGHSRFIRSSVAR